MVLIIGGGEDGEIVFRLKLPLNTIKSSGTHQ